MALIWPSNEPFFPKRQLRFWTKLGLRVEAPGAKNPVFGNTLQGSQVLFGLKIRGFWSKTLECSHFPKTPNFLWLKR